VETRYAINNQEVAVRVEREGAIGAGQVPHYRVTVGERVYHVQAQPGLAGRLVLEIEGRRVLAHVVAQGAKRFVALEGRSYVLAPPERRSRGRLAGAGDDTLTATMPGQVIAVKVAVGETVERGQTLVVLEAMKMELRVAAPHAGTVRAIHVSQGQTVDRGQQLVEIHSEQSE
jgi:biotin carboxyl carrier protein